MKWLDDFKQDYRLQFRSPLKGLAWARVFASGQMKMMLLGRLSQSWKCFRYIYNWIAGTRGVEIDFCRGRISAGVALAHAYNITVNSSAMLGQNVILFKGCTIGGIRGGHRGGYLLLDQE